MNILLIDDEKLELDQLEYMLKPHFKQHTFLRAQDVSAALSIIDMHKIHLALIDIQLPGRSGLELAEILMENNLTKVIMVTAYQSFEYAQQALRLKVENYITKPVVEAELLAVLKPYMDRMSQSDIVVRTIDFIRENYGSHITLTEAASVIPINHAYLSRKFNEEVGMSFSTFLNQFRIEMAKQYIQENPNKTIAEIAETCGFNSQHYFSSQFKKELGVTPSTYKREYYC